MQLLLVEDSESLVKVISHFMDGLFDSIIPASTLEGALAHILVDTPDVIWLDLTLEDSSSEHTLRKIPQIRAACPDATIVIMSGMADGELKQRCMEAGADAFLSKAVPIKAAQIIGLLGSGCLNRLSGENYEKNVELLEKVTQALTKLTPRKAPTPA